jgi:general stress protein 26
VIAVQKVKDWVAFFFTQDINDFLSIHIQIATIDPEGYPAIHPLWCLYERASGKIYVGTQKMTRKVQNILRNPDKIYFSIDDENYPYRGVKGRRYQEYLKIYRRIIQS